MSIQTWLHQEINRIIKITDNVEQEKQLQLLNEIIDKKNQYDFYILDYKKQQLIEDLEKRGATFEKIDITQESIMKKWENSFADGLTNDEKRKVYFSQFMWHICSYNKKEALQRTKARQAFNRVKKNQVYVFYQNKADVFYIADATNLKASDFDMEQDVYVVDSKMKWTYIHTHEMVCGPYFMRKKA